MKDEPRFKKLEGGKEGLNEDVDLEVTGRLVSWKDMLS